MKPWMRCWGGVSSAAKSMAMALSDLSSSQPSSQTTGRSQAVEEVQLNQAEAVQD